MVELGDRVEDIVTGLIGVVVSRTEWLYDCVRYGVQPVELGKDGKKAEIEYFDEPQLKVLKAGAFERVVPTYGERRLTGGPSRPEPPSQQ
jgi:hypothetical protein